MSESVWNAETLLKTSGVYWEACTLHAGVYLLISVMPIVLQKILLQR
jgi:hypothetical protein